MVLAILCKKVYTKLKNKSYKVWTNHKLHAEFSRVTVTGWYYHIFLLLYTKFLTRESSKHFYTKKCIWTGVVNIQATTIRMLISTETICPLWHILSVAAHLVLKNRDFGVLAPISKWNGDFAPIFSIVWFCPYFCKTKALFTLIFNSIS